MRRSPSLNSSSRSSTTSFKSYSDACVKDLEGGSAVTLHVYDLVKFASIVNRPDSWGRRCNVGLFHCGVEVHGEEYCFQYFYDAWEAQSMSGVLSHPPRGHPVFNHRESVNVGYTLASALEVKDIIKDLEQLWTSQSYHLTERNCVDFADAFVTLLQVDRVPRWIEGLAGTIRRRGILQFISNCAWKLMVSMMILISREMQAQCKLRDVRSTSSNNAALVPFLLACTTAILILPCLMSLPLLRETAGLEVHPLGLFFCTCAATIAALRHWFHVYPLGWLERGALLAAVAWALVRRLLAQGIGPTLTTTTSGALVFIALHQFLDNPLKVAEESRRGWSVALLFAHVLTAASTWQVMQHGSAPFWSSLFIASP